MAKSAFRFDAEERPEPEESRRGSSLPHPKNLGAVPELIPHRPPPPKSDPFHALHVDRRPATRERMISGRFGRKLDDVAPGTRPTPGSFEHHAATTCHRHPRDRRPAPNARDWSRVNAEPMFGHSYPAPSFDGSSASLGMRRDEVERYGRRIGPTYPHDFSEVVAEYGD